MRGRLVLAATALMLAGCETTADPRYALTVPLVGTAGEALGTVSLWESPGGVGMRLAATGVAHGLRGIHVHEVGRCEGPAFESAGAHWNPASRQHGLNNPAGPHAGDLPNVSVSANGVVNQSLVLSGASLAALSDADGSALVIHAATDDMVTDPSGNSGARIACAVIAASR